MRTRFAVLAAVLGATGLLVTPGIAAGAPAQVDGLTIATAPAQILAGQSMLIYGHLAGPDNAGQRIVLYHRIVPQPSFTIIQVGRTDSQGNYEFTRAEGIVNTDRSWFVVGPRHTHSNTVSEQVAALVSLNVSTTTAITGQPVVLTGHVFPLAPHARVLIQEQNGLNGNGWRTIAQTFTGGASNFTAAKAWRVPNAYTLRAVVLSDPRNAPGASDSVTVTIQQRQNPSFTITSSSPILAEGQPATISGTLDQPGTSTPVPDTQVTLYGARPRTGSFEAIGTTITDGSGDYSFDETPVDNTIYYVGETLTPSQRTASLFQGVQDQLTITASSGTASVGGTVQISGNVTPNKAGHEISLQVLGSDGFWHGVMFGTVGSGSSYSFTYQFGQTGTFELRARIDGGPANVGNASTPVTVTVSGVTPVPSLPATTTPSSS